MRVLKSVGILVLSGVSAMACERADGPSWGSVTPQATQGPNLAEKRPEGDFDAPAATRILNLMNQARVQAGLSPLAIDEALNRAAQAHILAMLRRGALSHQLDGESSLADRFVQNGVRFSRAAENIALDSSPEHAHQSLMASEDHRRNLLDPALNAVGIAVVWERCQVYVVQDFARQVPKYEAGQAEEVIAQKVASLRTQTHLPQLRLVKDAVAEQTCTGGNGALNRTGSPGRYVVSYSNAEPESIPASAASLIGNGRVKDISIGACYARTEKNPNGAYFVTMMFY